MSGSKTALIPIDPPADTLRYQSLLPESIQQLLKLRLNPNHRHPELSKTLLPPPPHPRYIHTMVLIPHPTITITRPKQTGKNNLHTM
ncbi:hypothetical protein TWF970_004376 [Orbilia oligospora]|uniref:Uncharacterized protein n=1 Tax=Orbilia oligospora TaxID=2813651 RepID=A0A7C8V6U8_ORBOL|nr:hypothetical protein TWF970_004376 [Orbilia oligospora]